MRSTWYVLMASPALVALSGCGSSPPPQTTQIILQQPAQTATVAPTPPPPPHSELVPPPPASSGPVVWQPGHWRYTGMAGNPWYWEGGRYVSVPPGSTTWVPGTWIQQAGSGMWTWQEGHWA